MSDYLILSNNNLLLRAAAANVAFISSDGSYTTMTLVGGEEYTFSFNLSTFERIIEQQLKEGAKQFIRVGRGLVINSNLIYLINVNKQELVLSDGRHPARYTLHVSKEALRSLKTLVEESLPVIKES